jgi:hypothetical protein
MRWLRDNRHRTGRPDSLPPAAAAWGFVREFARTRRYDCLDRRDLAPMLAELRITAAAVRSRNRLAPDLRFPRQPEGPVHVP